MPHCKSAPEVYTNLQKHTSLLCQNVNKPKKFINFVPGCMD